MHIEFLVEEPSSEAALQNILTRILQEQITYLPGTILMTGKKDEADYGEDDR